MRKEVCEYIRIQGRIRGYKNTTYKKGYRPRATRLRERLPTYVIPRKEHIANENERYGQDKRLVGQGNMSGF